ncbi:acylphosphatase [Craurococcus roseus]|uniref:acylphosphatase n=1 Tax=Craurococcus roseus TaxID=77585 RepID=A0ABN1EYC3_9PROT
MNARHLRIEGRVHGVGYRDWLVQEASRLGLYGWVRNRRDGSVEAVVAGDAAAVQELLTLCRRGPASARVDRITESFAEAPAEPGFRRLPSL